MNIPVINIAFNFDESRKNEEISRYYELDHFCEITSSNATDIVNDKDELSLSIARYLSNPSHKEIYRKNLVKEFLGFSGDAVLKLSNQIMDSIND